MISIFNQNSCHQKYLPKIKSLMLLEKKMRNNDY